MSIEALSTEQEAARLDALELAARLLDAALPLSVDQVQVLYKVILAEYPDYGAGKIALGIAFGELIAARADYEWVRVTDEYGSETSLAVRGFDASCHPISMMEKRVERSEEVDLAELRDETIALIQSRVDEGGWRLRRPN